MNERVYQHLADDVFRRIARAFDQLDPDQVDCEVAGDVVTLVFSGGPSGRDLRCILNTQRPTRQIWLAAGAHAWHFSYDLPNEVWVDDKGRGELFSVLAALVREHAGVELPLGRP